MSKPLTPRQQQSRIFAAIQALEKAWDVMRDVEGTAPHETAWITQFRDRIWRDRNDLVREYDDRNARIVGGKWK